MKIHCFSERGQCSEALAARIVQISADAISRRNQFSIVLTGGSTPIPLYETLASEPWRGRVDWSRTNVYFGDERCVPPDHDHSNYRMAYQSLLGKIPLEEKRIFRMRGEVDPKSEAKRYEQLMRKASESQGQKSDISQPFFDLVLLGLGSDGHVASLFPGDESLHHLGLVTDVPPPRHMQPSVARISMTLKAIGLARQVFFLVHGEAKEDIVKAVFLDSAHVYPASLVQGKTTSWYLSAMECPSVDA